MVGDMPYMSGSVYIFIQHLHMIFLADFFLKSLALGQRLKHFLPRVSFVPEVLFPRVSDVECCRTERW